MAALPISKLALGLLTALFAIALGFSVARALKLTLCRHRQVQTCKGFCRQLEQIAVMQVIYGDTDSIMVNTKSTELEQVGVGYSCNTCSNAHSHFSAAVFEV